MTKEQKSPMKSIEKAVQLSMKQEVRGFDCKLISNCLFERIGNYFIHAVWFIRFEGGQYSLILRSNIKLYNYDNLFWQIFDMEENTKQKDSFRANGAYIAPSIQYNEKIYVVTELAEIEQICAKAIREFSIEGKRFIEKLIFEFDNFDLYVLSQTGIMDEMLLKMLAYINMNKYVDAERIAKSELEKGRSGRFENNGLGINQYVLNFCKRKEMPHS